MGRGKSYIKKVSISSKDDTDMLNKMFGQMTGAHAAEPDVIIPKIINIHDKIIKYNKLFSVLLDFKEFTDLFQDYSMWFDEIKTFLSKLTETTNTDVNKKYNSSLQSTYENMTEEQINELYKKLKENVYVKEMIITSSNLSIHKKYLSDKNNLTDTFINREPGLVFQPFAFTSMDLKLIWNFDNITDNAKKFILSILSHTYTLGIDLYDIITSPDVNIKKFSQILVDSIGKLRKQIPRCDKAFDVIENSVKLLEDNFKSYYRNSVESSNPSIIVENFVVDISTSQKANAITTSQFRRIVSYLKQKNTQSNDPKIKKLFGMLNSQFSAIDKEIIPCDTEQKNDEEIQKNDEESEFELVPELEEISELKENTE